MIDALITPLALLHLITLAGLLRLRRRQRDGRRGILWVACPLALLYLFSTPPAAYLVMHPLERPYQTSTEVATDAEAIVVLAGSIRTAQGARTSAEPGPDTVYRCLHAAALHRSAPHLPVIICGGADGQGGPAYSYVMRDFLLGQGVRAEAIVMDDRSRNTFENAVEASRLLRERGLQRASLVTDASHMRRAVGCFQMQGVEVSPSACNHLQPEYHPKLSHLLPSSRSVAVVNAAFHEWLGLLVYRVRGRI